MSTSSRRGFTLVELLIVIAIIGVLMGLLLPAIQAARERSRMAQCSNNLRELALAVKNLTTSKGSGEYPGWADEVKRATDVLAVPWTFALLSRIDEETLREQILNGDVSIDAPPKISLFMCPSDASTNATIGLLTYVINSGMFDSMNPRGLNGLKSDLKANGVAHDQRSGRDGPVLQSGTADIKDGESKTLLFSENVNKDVQALALGRTATWLGPLQQQQFTPNGTNPAVNVQMSSNPEQRFGMVWVYDEESPFAPNFSLVQPFNRDDDSYSGAFGEAGPRFARPTSTHPEVFMVAFCGGNNKEISENIEYRVYQQLMTPNGQKVASYEKENILIEAEMRQNNNGKGFMTPPLNEGEY
jgi:prepilin-type N-terminal cleavage/methylation domain-containing protein